MTITKLVKCICLILKLIAPHTGRVVLHSLTSLDSHIKYLHLPHYKWLPVHIVYAHTLSSTSSSLVHVYPSHKAYIRYHSSPQIEASVAGEVAPGSVVVEVAQKIVVGEVAQKIVVGEVADHNHQ